MARTRKGNAGTDAKDKVNHSSGKLPTPEPTPGVDAARVAADQARKVANAQQDSTSSAGSEEDAAKTSLQEIERVLKCEPNSYAAILSVPPTASEEELLVSWRRLGCMVHPNYCKHEKVKAAFESK